MDASKWLAAASTLVLMGRKSRFKRERVVNNAGAYSREQSSGGNAGAGWLFLGELFGNLGGNLIGKMVAKIVEACFRLFHH